MKKIILILITNLSLNCFSQREFTTNFGFKAGLSQGYVSGKDSEGLETGYVGMDFYGALFADTKIGKNTFLENEILFSYTYNYHFIEIPVHFKHTIFKNLTVLYGMKLDFAINKEPTFYQYEPSSFSTEIGTQYHFTKKTFAEVRYSYGLKGQINDNLLDIINGKRNTLRFGLGLKF